MEITMSKLCGALGLVGGVFATSVGGWDSSIKTLLLFMGIDYVTGLILSIIFKKSSKTGDGTFMSAVGAIGLVKKLMIIVLIAMAHRIDIMLGVNYVRDSLAIAFIVNESLSIVENAGLMGVPVPEVLMNGISVLKGKEEKSE